MAKGGNARFSSTLTGGSDFIYDYKCELCEQDGLHKEAVGYCRNCSDYLCAECYRTHCRPTPLRDHVLLDKDHMPQHPKCDLCQKDGKSLDAEGFCNDCGDYLCKECFHTHLRPRPLRNHVLLDKSKMPRLLRDRSDDKKTQAEHVETITVMSEQDKNKPYITGCVVLPEDKLVLVDLRNSNVKLVNLTNNIIHSQLELPQFIFDVTQVKNNQVAITSHSDEVVYFVNVTYTSTLKLDRKINVGGRCRGITCVGDTLLVVNDCPPKVEILDMTGKLLQTVLSENRGEQIFTGPWYMAVNKDAQKIYIADQDTNTVACVSMTGQFRATFASENLKWPSALVVDKVGDVYVCGRGTHNLFQMTEDLTQPCELIKEAKEMIHKVDGNHDPTALGFCETTNRLYIGMFESSRVEVFQLK